MSQLCCQPVDLPLQSNHCMKRQHLKETEEGVFKVPYRTFSGDKLIGPILVLIVQVDLSKKIQ